MSEETPNASRHPAMMPGSVSEPPAPSNTSNDLDAPTHAPTSPEPRHNTAAEHIASSEAETSDEHGMDQAADTWLANDEEADAWLPKEDDADPEAGDAWLASDDASQDVPHNAGNNLESEQAAETQESTDTLQHTDVAEIESAHETEGSDANLPEVLNFELGQESLPDTLSQDLKGSHQSQDVEELPQASDSLPDTSSQDLKDSYQSQDVEELPQASDSLSDTLSQDLKGSHQSQDVEELPQASDSLPDTSSQDLKDSHQSQDVEELPQASAPSGSYHSSSMSFTRTSREVNFNEDEDDGDWTLSRTDTDPFKFMPATDRTNSFPVVPPQNAMQDGSEEVPLATTQASQIAEQDVEEVSQEPMPEVAQHRRGPSASMGGDVLGTDVEASGARYEEGLPLISHSSADDSHSQDEHGGGATVSFDDDEGGDDFFSNVGQSGGDPSTYDYAPALERKSTMQAVGDALCPNGESRHSPLEETLEEEDEVETPMQQAPRPQEDDQMAGVDLSSKWSEAFGAGDDDDDFLLDDATANNDIDARAFLGSDDEGFLEDDDEGFLEDDGEPATATPATRPAPMPEQPKPANPYLPQGLTSSQSLPVLTGSTLNAPAPAPGANSFYQQPAASNVSNAPTPTPASTGSRATSFADKSKGGYASPYDLPTDLVTSVVKPRKRASAQQLQSTAPAMQPPPPSNRSTSMFTPGPPSSTGSPPNSSHGAPLGPKTSAPPLRNKGSFFEELPVVPKARPSSRQSNFAPSPVNGHPTAQSPQTTNAQMAPPPPPSGSNYAAPPQRSQSNYAHPPQQPPSSSEQPDVTNLVAPERASPYASLAAAAPIMPAASANASRYSPAPPAQQLSNSVPPAPASRYSPGPPSLPRSHSSYTAAPGSHVSPVLPHQPRTSSPLAHFELNRAKSQGDSAGEMERPERRASAQSYEPRLNRVSSLPPTREVDEEDERAPTRTVSAQQDATGRYSPAPPVKANGQMSPSPSTPSGQQTLSPSKSAKYAPQPPPSAGNQNGFVPPPRAQTQSPSTLYGAAPQVSAPTAQPSSVHTPTTPAPAKPAQSYAPASRPRGGSIDFNMVPPNDSRAQDPLHRWKGAALLAWGVGGTVVTCFPKSVPRYGLNQTTPSIIRSHGEVKVRTIKEIDPLQERLAKFPGPLKGKSKKKETLSWLANGIESIEKELPDVGFHAELSLEAKRSMERLLLWRILRIFVEFDGVLEGTPAVEKAVRDVLSPSSSPAATEGNALYGGAGLGSKTGATTGMGADGADASAMEQIRADLLKGDGEAAVWAAVDKRLWGHAMLLSQTVSADLYKRVSQEFVRKEVNYPGHANESLGALYKILSGNHEDCVDELIPSHARAGLQLISAGTVPTATGATADGLDKWRETLALVLGNRSADDVKGIKALGGLLASYGRAEAAHVCYLFARSVSVFGGKDDPTADFVLLGADHRQQSDLFGKETEALELSEVYEYGLSLTGSASTVAGSPHLAGYKLQHAVTMAEYGFRDRALQYCDAIATAMTSQTRRSPYHHALLHEAVDDFSRRLKQAPKEESGSWMSKPSMNKLSGSLLSKFNTFVSGDEAEGAQGGSEDQGHFARIATTPNMSRSPSVNNFEMYGASPNAGPGLISPTNAVPSKYAPVAPSFGGPASGNPYEPAPYAPAQSTGNERGSGEYSRNQYNPGHSAAANALPSSSGYAPLGAPFAGGDSQNLAPSPSFGGYAPQPPQPVEIPQPHSQAGGAMGENGGASLAQGSYEPPSYGYQPPDMSNPASGDGMTGEAQQGSSGSEPASYGYQPPSYEPDLPANDGGDDDEPKPKKKSFMDDDDDDIPAAPKKSRAELDRENEEMFRKAAEEDAKRAAAQKAEKKGWGFGGWFGGGKKAEAPTSGEAPANKPIKAKLGEASTFVYDPELKRWINKAPGAENVEAKTATPPPPKAGPRSVSGTPPPSSAGTPPPPSSSGSMMPPRSIPTLAKAPSQESMGGAPMARSVSNTSAAGMPSAGGPPSRPPSRPTTSMSNASSIDDLLGAAGPRKASGKKPRKSGRYVDVMAKQ